MADYRTDDQKIESARNKWLQPPEAEDDIEEDEIDYTYLINGMKQTIVHYGVDQSKESWVDDLIKVLMNEDIKKFIEDDIKEYYSKLWH